MTIDQAVTAVQLAYPQIYYACHIRHTRRRSNERHLSQRDSSILVHLDQVKPIRLNGLARHLDLAPSTLSEAVGALSRFGYVDKTPSDARDRRAIGLRLTEKGAAAVRAASVLDASVLARALRRLDPLNRKRAVDGLVMFAAACRRRV